MAEGPPLPAIGNAIVELQGPLIVGNNKWDTAKWDEAVWLGTTSWWDITPQSVNVHLTWGTDDNQGALSAPAAGSWSVITYDPNRLLDPANQDSAFASFLKPGGLIRIRYKAEQVRLGFIDEVTFDMAARTGEIRGTDAISLMVKAKLPDGLMHDTAAPLSLRARARWLLAKASIAYVTVEADPAGELDPIVGLPMDTATSVWAQIVTAAYDALHAVWLDRNGVLRFRWFGNPFATSMQIGRPINGMDVETIETKVSMEGAFNHFIGRMDTFSENWYNAKNQPSIDKYGDLVVERERPNPDADTWAKNLLVDRDAAAVQYGLGVIRPQTEAQLMQILDMPMAGKVWIYLTSQGPTINKSPIVLGGAIEANTETGWSASLTTYHRTTGFHAQTRKQYRRITATQSIELVNAYGGANTNKNGAQHEVRVSPNAAAGDETHFMLMQGPSLAWGDVASLPSAYLRLYRPFHQDTGNRRFREEGWVKVTRLVGAWDENTVFPGPADTSDGEAVLYFDGGGLSSWLEINVTAIVQRWREGQPNYGVRIQSSWGNLQAGQDDEHFIISGRQSTQKPYILATVTV